MSGDISELRYTLRALGEILEKLRLMQKKKSPLTVRPLGQSATFVTTVLEVLPEKGLVVLETGLDPAMNRLLLSAERSVLDTRVDGIRTRFALGRVAEATLHGQPVFAAPFPEELLWLQQRRFFRVVIPGALPVRCWVPLPETLAEFPVIDLSISGLALHDRALRITEAMTPGTLLEACRLLLPGHGEIAMSLEVRYRAPLIGAEPAGQRVGCQFHGLGRSGEIQLQKFIYEVELHHKRQEERTRE